MTSDEEQDKYLPLLLLGKIHTDTIDYDPQKEGAIHNRAYSEMFACANTVKPFLSHPDPDYRAEAVMILGRLIRHVNLVGVWLLDMASHEDNRDVRMALLDQIEVMINDNYQPSESLREQAFAYVRDSMNCGNAMLECRATATIIAMQSGEVDDELAPKLDWCFRAVPLDEEIAQEQFGVIDMVTHLHRGLSRIADPQRLDIHERVLNSAGNPTVIRMVVCEILSTYGLAQRTSNDPHIETVTDLQRRGLEIILACDLFWQRELNDGLTYYRVDLTSRERLRLQLERMNSRD
ncbi:MAG: hypothetical protein H7175_14820 [Burkholderiales bacterium]|nr:hypothetical protein [Anaerolineae bacterium]